MPHTGIDVDLIFFAQTLQSRLERIDRFDCDAPINGPEQAEQRRIDGGNLLVVGGDVAVLFDCRVLIRWVQHGGIQRPATTKAPA